METFSMLLAICGGNSPVTGEFPTQRPVTRSFDVLFDLRLNKRLSKQSGGWWFETLSRSLWCHCNDFVPLPWQNDICELFIERFKTYTNYEYQIYIPRFVKDITHYWGQVMHICITILGYIGSDNGLSPIRPLGTNWSQILFWKLEKFHSRKCLWKCHLENVAHFVSASMC